MFKYLLCFRHLSAFRKHAYSNILKISVCKRPRRGGSKEYLQSIFFSRNKISNVYPCKPQFYCIKVGFKWGGGGGATLYRHVFVMESRFFWPALIENTKDTVVLILEILRKNLADDLTTPATS